MHTWRHFVARRILLWCCSEISQTLRDAQVEASPKDLRRIMMRGRKVAAWRRLRLPERDVLTVLTAICKVHHLRC
jgi:hypothetical protein